MRDQAELARLLNGLAQERPVFHSEADFQHALAWSLHQAEPQRRLRLEYRPPTPEPMYVDLLMRDPDGHRIAVELKYWTKRLETSMDDEPFLLRDQGAHDISRYDFIKDIARVESLTARGAADAGWVIALTNDPSYWNPATRPDTIDAAFLLTDGRTLGGRLSWSDAAGPGTTRGRQAVQQLTGSYELSWRDFSHIAGVRNGQLRYLATHVTPPTA